MKYSLSFIALPFLLFLSCATNSQKAVEFNNLVINEQQRISELAIKLVDTMRSDISKCKEIRLDIVKQCDESLAAIKKLKGFEGSERMKNAAIELFSFYKKIYSNEYKQMFDILDKGVDITEEDLAFIQKMEVDVTKQEEKLDKEFADAQQELATKFNFQMEENENQQKIDAIK